LAGLEAGGDGQTSVDGFAGTRGGADCGGRERAEVVLALSVAPSSVVKWTQRQRGEVDAKAAGDWQRRAA
jgi:hypothetical protein